MKGLLLIGVIVTVLLNLLMGSSNYLDNHVTEGEKINLTLWLDNDGYAKTLIVEMEEVFPHLNFIYENVGTNDSLDKLTLDGPAGIGGDIMLLSRRQAHTAMNDQLLLPVGDTLGKMIEEQVLESAALTVKKDDRYFGVPMAIETVALFYNKTLLDEYNLPVATSFEELIKQAELFNSSIHNQFILRFEAGSAYTSHFFLTAYGYQLFGPNYDDVNLVNLDSPEVVAGLELFQSVREILPVPAGDLNWDHTVGSFINGETPYVITGSWSISELQTVSDFEWGVSKIPTINGIQPITFLGNIVAGISAFTDYPDEAREVLEFIASNKGLQIIYEERGSIPAVKDVSGITGLACDPSQVAFLAQAEYSFPNPTLPEMSVFWNVANLMHEAVWEGILNPEEAATRAGKEFEAAVSLLRQ